jgi:hypothetical protein
MWVKARLWLRRGSVLSWATSPNQKRPLSLWKCCLQVFIPSINKILFLVLGSLEFAKMVQLLNSIITVTKVFQNYAKDNGDCTSLCKKELKQLLLTEFGDILRVRYIDGWPHGIKVNDSDICIQVLMSCFIWSCYTSNVLESTLVHQSAYQLFSLSIHTHTHTHTHTHHLPPCIWTWIRNSTNSQ